MQFYINYIIRRNNVSPWSFCFDSFSFLFGYRRYPELHLIEYATSNAAPYTIPRPVNNNNIAFLLLLFDCFCFF